MANLVPARTGSQQTFNDGRSSLVVFRILVGWVSSHCGLRKAAEKAARKMDVIRAILDRGIGKEERRLEVPMGSSQGVNPAAAV